MRRMAALRLAAVCVALLALRVSAEMAEIRAVPGQDVTLPCRAPSDVLVIEWFKPGEEGRYLLLYRAGLILPDGQHPSYRSRVAFHKEKVGDGDASLTLRTVGVEDSGTYTCMVVPKTKKSRSSMEMHPKTYIHLTVDPAPSSSADRGGGALGLVALQLVLAAAVGSV